MDRKTYITPKVKVLMCDSIHLLCSSLGSSFGGGIGYGGVDEDGSVTAGVRSDNVWDNDAVFGDEFFGE